MAITFLFLAAVSAVLDWIAVAYRFFRLEYLFKPLTLALLTVAAATADLGPAQSWIVAGLVLGLGGGTSRSCSAASRCSPTRRSCSG